MECPTKLSLIVLKIPDLDALSIFFFTNDTTSSASLWPISLKSPDVLSSLTSDMRNSAFGSIRSHWFRTSRKSRWWPCTFHEPLQLRSGHNWPIAANRTMFWYKILLQKPWHTEDHDLYEHNHKLTSRKRHCVKHKVITLYTNINQFPENHYTIRSIYFTRYHVAWRLEPISNRLKLTTWETKNDYLSTSSANEESEENHTKSDFWGTV